ncbi:hypothetical protein PMI38_00566, partial [Pseudomonas sp. GM84]
MMRFEVRRALYMACLVAVKITQRSRRGMRHCV